jgi:hypothetical protein
MSDPEARREATQADEEGDADAADLDGLRLRGDVEGLLALAKACRAGTAPGGRDLPKCYAAYAAAAELGSGDAEYAVALFHLSGGVVPQDFKVGSTRLRGAAEKGSVAAKVYLGNLYELGIFYKADPEKADVWYRNAARGAKIASEPGTDEYTRDLAELGCARYVLALTSAGETEKTGLTEADKTRLLQRAKAHGYGLRLKEETASDKDRPTLLNALEGADDAAAKVAKEPAKDAAGAAVKEAAAAKEKEAAKERPAKPSAASAGLTAFGYALVFLVAGLGAGYAASAGATELVAHGHTLPVIGARTELAFPLVFGGVGVLPTFLVYRFMAVIKALVIGAAFAGIGWVAWGTGQGALHAHRLMQANAFAIAGFIAGLLVLGLVGGAKRTTHPPR